jgi:hypothetical protein
MEGPEYKICSVIFEVPTIEYLRQNALTLLRTEFEDPLLWSSTPVSYIISLSPVPTCRLYIPAAESMPSEAILARTRLRCFVYRLRTD